MATKKILKAETDGLHVVSEAFIVDCIEKGKKLDEKDYKLGSSETKPAEKETTHETKKAKVEKESEEKEEEVKEIIDNYEKSKGKLAGAK